MKLFNVNLFYDVDDYKRRGNNPYSEDVLCRNYRSALNYIKNEIESNSENNDLYMEAVEKYPSYFYSDDSDDSDDNFYYIKRVKDNDEYLKRLEQIHEISARGEFVQYTWTWCITNIDYELEIFSDNDSDIKFDEDGIEKIE